VLKYIGKSNYQSTNQFHNLSFNAEYGCQIKNMIHDYLKVHETGLGLLKSFKQICWNMKNLNWFCQKSHLDRVGKEKFQGSKETNLSLFRIKNVEVSQERARTRQKRRNFVSKSKYSYDAKGTLDY